MDGEAAWIRQVATGDERALRALYDALGGRVFALARTMLHSPEDAEEVVQDTFVRVYEQAGRYRPERGSPRAWIYTIARNECRMRLRARRSRPRRADGIDPHAPDARVADRRALPPAPDRVALRAALDGLSEADAALVVDAYLRGWSHRELADREALPVGTVKSRLRRALRTLRGHLRDGPDGRPGEDG